jgi:hypothetical protein
MAQMTPQASKVLEKALTLSTQERGVFIDRLIESLDEDPRAGYFDGDDNPTGISAWRCLRQAGPE